MCEDAVVMELETIDRQLLNLVQAEIPLVERPFAAIGKQLGLGEEEVIRRLAGFKTASKRVIRQISAIFDSKSLGYQSTLVAAKIGEPQLERAVAIINEHPGVSHNY